MDVNASGEIVGYSETRRDGPHAFIYADGVLSDLNDLADAGNNTLRWANGINDDGDIVGHMRVPASGQRAAWISAEELEH